MRFIKKIRSINCSALVVCLFFSFLSSCSKIEVADLVVYGTIYTAEKENNSLASAFAVKDGKYIYVGDVLGVNKYIKEGYTEVIDYGNDGLIIPGATEGHGHFVGIGSLVEKFPCYNEQFDSIVEELLKEMNQENKPKFFISWGLNYDNYTKDLDGWDRMVCYADLLNQIASDIPVVCFDNAGHQALCNTFALKKAGLIDDNGEVHPIRGGSIVMTTSNPSKYSGWVSDEIAPYVVEKTIDLKELDSIFFEDAVKTAAFTLNERGFTNYLDAYINYFDDDVFYKAINEVDKENQLTVNISSCHTIRSFEVDNYNECIKNIVNLSNQYHSEHFNPYNVKLFADGVVELMTGWLLEPYQEGEDYYGNQIWSQDELNNIVYECNKAGLDIHTHAFGDAACRASIDSYIYSDKKLGKHSNNTLAHVRNITLEDIMNAADNNIGIAENLIWHSTSDEYDLILNQAVDMGLLSKDITFNGYPMKTLIDSGVLVSSSTDSPCGEQVLGNIQNVIEVATTGITPMLEGNPYNPDELLTVKEILECLTINGAKQLGIDDKCGSIKVGKNADFVIMDTNFLDYTELKDLRTIHDVKIDYVYFEGKKVYSRYIKY